MSKILLVHPGAEMSTADVHRGVSDGLRAIGHTVYDYSLNARIAVSGGYLNWLWKRGDKTSERPTESDILYHAGQELVTRALRVQPDVVLVVSAMYLHPDVLVLMRRAGLKVAVLFTESPYDDERQVRLLEYLDLAWTNERASATAMGIRYLPHAWHPDVHCRAEIDGDVPAHDVVFVGTGFQERCDLLAAVDWTGIDVGLYGSWDLLGSRNRLRQHIKGSYIKNSYAAQLYQRAKIGLNLYRTSKGFGRGAPKIAAAESLNPRAYELAAMGCFTVSDDRPEVGEVFGPLVPTFRTPDELETVIRQWLRDDIGRARIQAQLPVAVAHATWLARAHQMEADLVDAGIVARHGNTQPAAEFTAAVNGG